MIDRYDPDYWSFDQDGNPEYHGHGPAKEEPNCYTCNDSGSVIEFPHGGGERVTNCPDCNPTDEQAAATAARFAAQQAEFRAAVERGEATYDEAPF